MPVISLETAMQHLRYPDDEPEYITLLMDAAEDHAMQFLDRRFYADQQSLDAAVEQGSAGDRPMLINASITAACLLILGHLHAHREEVVIGTTSSRLPAGSINLLTPYRIGMGI